MRTPIPVLAAAIALSLLPSALAQVRLETIAPLATDSTLSGWTSNHAAAFSATANQRGTLFLFLHGQGGTGTGALELLTTAAEEGFHAVGLTYPNDWSPFNFCNGSGDPDCGLKLRREIISGADLSPFIAVGRADSVENRLIKLLQRLDVLHPTEGWGDYLEGDAIRWDAVALWGHSQGGGNAGVIAKDHEVARCCTSAPAADGGFGAPAAWWAQHATPSQRYFGLSHTQDALAQKVAFWNALGAPGPVTDVANAMPPYAGSHQLSTSVAPAVAGQFHNSPVIDSVTPRLPDGTPRYKDTWRYMLTATPGEPPEPTFWDDVVYATVPITGGGTIDLRIDIHGATAGAPPYPTLIWIHGGGWESGSHNLTPAFALALRERGITVASIEYRLSQEAVFPAQIHDCKGAIRFLRANAAAYNLDPRRFAVWGSSAGGHLAALVSTSGNMPSLEGSTGGNVSYSSAVVAGLAYFPPTDLLNMRPDCGLQTVGCSINHDDPTSGSSKLLGVSGAGQGLAWIRDNLANPADPFPALAALAASSNPVVHVDPADPPMYLAHGDRDTTVPLNQSFRLRDALTSAGVPVIQVTAAGFGHGSLGTAVNNDAAEWALTQLFACNADFNRDGDAGTDADIEAFFACLAGNCCNTCGTADFNGDGDTGTDEDIAAFFRVLAGGAC